MHEDCWRCELMRLVRRLRQDIIARGQNKEEGLADDLSASRQLIVIARNAVGEGHNV